jgi:hypothetical protein
MTALARGIRAVAARGVIAAALGVGTTVAVAWWLALFVDVAGRSRFAETHRAASVDGFELTMVARVDQPGTVFVCSLSAVAPDTGPLLRAAARLGVTGGEPVETPPGTLVDTWAWPAMTPRLRGGAPPAAGAVEWGAAEARGWPWPALWCAFDEGPSGPRVSGAIELPGRVVRKGREFPAAFPAALPVRPVWAGLAADSAVWAGVWWLALLVPGEVRRGVRRTRGRCTGCGYDRTGLDRDAPCPECGRRPRRARTPGDGH